MPIKTTFGPTPGSVLKHIYCNCKSKSKNACGKMTCTYPKNGLQCISARADCRGQHCENKSVDQHALIAEDNTVRMKVLI